MKIVLFYHSLISDWNHGNAHFLRGIATELVRRGHDVRIYEPADAWSVTHLVRDHGTAPIAEFHARYPMLRSHRYGRLDLQAILNNADLVIVHEWTPHELVRAIGENRPSRGALLFHDTHHRAVTCPEAMRQYDLGAYDGVLAYGSVLRDLYIQRSWTRRAWTWHEAADTDHFFPISPTGPMAGDLVWIGNWGDDERTAELEEFLIRPVERLRLKASVYGVRYPQEALERLAKAGISYRGWLPNYKVPEIFAEYRATVHIPRRPYATTLPGIPTIRPFEALACGIPLVCAPWIDSENLFTTGKDYLSARDGKEMETHLAAIFDNPAQSRAVAEHGLQTVRERHTCRHRVDELLNIYFQIAENP